MKTIKYMLAMVILAAGLNAGAQTHENTQPKKTVMRKVRTNEKAKASPDSKVKTDENAHSGEAIQHDKASEKSVTPTEKEKSEVAPAKKQDVQKVNADQPKTDDKGKEKMKQIKRPVKKAEPMKKAG